MKSVSLLVSFFLVEVAQAGVVNNQFELDLCSLSAVYKAANSQGAYEGPNEPTFVLEKLRYMTHQEGNPIYFIKLRQIDDGDMPVNSVTQGSYSVLQLPSGHCPLPRVSWPIVEGEKAPRSKCLPANKDRIDIVSCNENRWSYVGAYDLGDYTLIPHNMDVLSQVSLMNKAREQILLHRPNFDFNNGGKFYVEKAQLVASEDLDEDRVEIPVFELRYVVHWLDQDDDSYAVHFSEDLELLYVTYLN